MLSLMTRVGGVGKPQKHAYIIYEWSPIRNDPFAKLSAPAEPQKRIPLTGPNRQLTTNYSSESIVQVSI